MDCVIYSIVTGNAFKVSPYECYTRKMSSREPWYGI